MKKITNFIFYIEFILFDLFFRFLTYLIPFMLLIVHSIIYFSAPLILIGFSSIFLWYFKFKIDIKLAIYLSLIIYYFFLTFFNKPLLLLIEFITPARYNSSKKLKPYNIKEISEDILSIDNVKLIIYVLNFIFIIFINIIKFQNFKIYNNINFIENPLLQSFVTFIAFERIISLSKSIKIKPATLNYKILKGIKDKIEELKKE